MKLIVTYDPDPMVDAMRIYIPRRSAGGIELPGEHIIIHSGTWEDNRDIVEAEFLFVSGYVAPYFQLNQPGAPFKAGDPEHTRYDRETDTLTWGTTTDDPEMVSQAGDLTAYWQLDLCLSEEDEPFFEPIGLSLRNAAKHLYPHFVRVEPPVTG